MYIIFKKHRAKCQIISKYWQSPAGMIVLHWTLNIWVVFWNLYFKDKIKKIGLIILDFLQFSQKIFSYFM
jgi:hypothetical protein